MTTLTNPIDKLRSLNLSQYPIEEINNLLNEFEGYGLMTVTLHEGKGIIRARPNEDNEPFKLTSDLSYKPAKYNTKFQRASTPSTTMFYGCVVPENISQGEIDSARVTAICEASKLYRQGIENGEEKITFGRFKVTKDIPLVAIVHHEEFIKNSSHTKELHNASQKFLEKFSKDIPNSNAVTKYLASEFAKAETPNDYDYLISALFTELVLQKGFAGVYYPSVRAEGKGFNIAVHPDYVISNMIPIAIGECTLYKKGKQIVLDNDSIVELEIGQSEFILTPLINTEYHSGRDTCYKILNGEIKL